MKKSLPIAIMLLASIATIVACSKKEDSNPVGNYTCRCIITIAGVKDTVDLPFTSVPKNTATANCATAQTTYNISPASATCAIK